MHISPQNSPKATRSEFSLPKSLPNVSSPPSLGDRFEQSHLDSAEPDMRQAKEMFQPQDSGGIKTRKALGYALALGLGMVGLASPAVAAPRVESVQQTAISRALQNPNARKLLSKLPANFAKTATGLSDGQVKVLKGGMQGSTYGFNNRKAFIRGHVVGKKVWPEVNNQINDAYSKHGMISKSERNELLQIIRDVSGMSSGQREIMANLMDYVSVR
jgi:hypothetical protein